MTGLQAYLLNSLWQVPLLFAAGRLAARALRSAGPAAEHRVWVAVLLLQSLLPACSALPVDWLPMLFSTCGQAGQAHVSVTMGAGLAAAALPFSGAPLTAAALAYAAVSAWFLARFLWRLQTLSRIRRDATALTFTGWQAACWAACAQRFGIRGASMAASPRVFGPVTLGIRRKLLLLPANLVAALPPADLHTVLAHEFAHMRRADFTKNLLYELLSLPVSYHPLLRLTRAHLTETREMLCDHIAAELAGPTEYAQSLLRLASLLVQARPVAVPHAIGILDANTFERRLMQLTGKHHQLRPLQRASRAVACAALGFTACGAALALGVHVNAARPGNESTANAPAPNTVKVPSGVVAGKIVTKVNPKYPEAAKKAKIQGSVVLDATIGKDGAIGDLQVVSGPEELRQSTLDAVRQWTYEPFLLNGNPVNVQTTITVTYSLAG